MLIGLIIGFLGGILGGMGMGGGTLLIPLLTLFLGIYQKEAQTISLVTFVCMAGFAIFIHVKNGLVSFKEGVLLTSTGVVSAIFMALLVQKIDGGILKTLFGIFLICIAALEIVTIIKGYIEEKQGRIKH
ncbi:MAG: sulfite exporter TauE/SafE family protein [Christensenellaceae bacterium]|jgi:uncharacterized membrane protein YfcA|nr:sulfite exporter TauE/SafE family protein [Christensenellaceae bacterium]